MHSTRDGCSNAKCSVVRLNKVKAMLTKLYFELTINYRWLRVTEIYKFNYVWINLHNSYVNKQIN